MKIRNIFWLCMLFFVLIQARVVVDIDERARALMGHSTVISQRNFVNGTYIITKPGYYLLKENIVFDPIGGNHICHAAILVNCDDVVIDLNGKTLTISDQYVSHDKDNQFSLIVCGKIRRESGVVEGVRNTIIRNGVLGKTIHYGIYGTDNADIYIQDLEIRNWNHAAICLEHVHNAVIRSVIITGLDESVNTPDGTPNNYATNAYGIFISQKTNNETNSTNQYEVEKSIIIDNVMIANIKAYVSVDFVENALSDVPNGMFPLEYPHDLIEADQNTIAGIYVQHGHGVMIKNCSIVGFESFNNGISSCNQMHGILFEKSDFCSVFDCEMCDCFIKCNLGNDITFLDDGGHNIVENCILHNSYIKQQYMVSAYSDDCIRDVWFCCGFHAHICHDLVKKKKNVYAKLEQKCDAVVLNVKPHVVRRPRGLRKNRILPAIFLSEKSKIRKQRQGSLTRCYQDFLGSIDI